MRGLRLLFRLRVEEATALAFLLPTTWLTLHAYGYALEAGVLSSKFPAGMVRVAVAAVALAALAVAVRRWPRSPFVRGLREAVPFVACILIYTNLHDTIGFVNPHDVHYWLAALDDQLLGVQPSVWAEQFITPARTEVMQFFYLSFFWIAPSTSLLLLLRRRWPEFRATTLSVVMCFYLGYVLYVLFPAAPPRLVLVYDFTRNLRGYPTGLSVLAAQAFSLIPADSRAAFPSLHVAVSLVALVCAWRYLRSWFWGLLPFVLGLWVATVYLRHHYFVDVLAGWVLAPLALWVAPRIDAFWTRRRRELGYLPPLGARGSLES